MKKLFKSFSYAFTGYKSALKEERNMQIHTFIAIVVIIFGFLFNISLLEWIFVVLAIGLVVSAEIINTSIENMVDLVTKEKDERAKIIKDTSAAYVMILSFTAAVIGLIIFIPKIIEFLEKI